MTDAKDSCVDHGPEDLQASFQCRLEKVAKLLHDDILQTFATCLLKAQYCERLAQLDQYDQVKRELSLLEDTLSDTIDSVRELVSTLRNGDDEVSLL